MTETINKAVHLLDTWLNSMRHPMGYSGPVSHWWESSLVFTGPMIDWRYEGILAGYVQLFQTTNNTYWLDQAIQAGEDIRKAQLPDGRYWNSSFQIGTLEGGTPHEAAVNVGLLELATALKGIGDDRWKTYFAVAERNIEEYHFKRLWNGTRFLDQAWNKTTVANKNATIMESLLLYEALTGKSMQVYFDGIVPLIDTAQVQDESHPAYGGIVHLGTHHHKLAIGIYTARVASALVRLYQHHPDDAYLKRAQKMGACLAKLISPADRGSYMGYYADGTAIKCPAWVSPSGDILRTFVMLKPYGTITDDQIDQLVQILLSEQLSTGGIPTAYGLGQKGGVTSPPKLPDFRDVLPVVGWIDKTFRGLAMLVDSPIHRNAQPQSVEIPCTWQGKSCVYVEDDTSMSLLQDNRQVIYKWQKGTHFPEIYAL